MPRPRFDLCPLAIALLMGAVASLAATDTLQRDDGSILYAFRFPDAFGDDLRSMRFVAPEECRLVGAWFAFGTRGHVEWTTGDPTLITKVWSSTADSLPHAELLSDSLPFESYSSSVFDLDSVWRASTQRFVAVDLSTYDLRLDSGSVFHLGYTTDRSPGDSLAILADDGLPPTYYACEWYNGGFHYMRESWPGVNLLIRAVVQLGDLEVRTISSLPDIVGLAGAYPNPFNSKTTISISIVQASDVELEIYDLLGRSVFSATTHRAPPGVLRLNWQPDGASSGRYFGVVRALGEVQYVPLVYLK